MLTRSLIARYVLKGAIPYALLSLLLLTAILLVQQAGQFAELVLSADLPMALAAQIAVTLLPSVMVLTLPVAVLAGIVIGFARMGSDSEIVAMRAAGVGTWALLWPALLIGVLATVVAIFLHMSEAPRAAREFRRATLTGLLRKLESPVEPRTFNTDFPSYVIYVRDGDKAQGTWAGVFINVQREGVNRILTARSGRIDSSAEKAELVLSDVVELKMPPAESTEHNYEVLQLAQVRVAMDTGRAALVDRLTQKEVRAEELDWNDLKKRTHSEDIGERREAERALHRRLALSVAPLVFALFGGLSGIRIRRGGRGAGILLSIATIVIYYLISLLGESLARTNSVPTIVAMWMATAVVLLFSLMMLRFRPVPGLTLVRRLMKSEKRVAAARTKVGSAHTRGATKWGFPSLLDTSLFRTLAISFLLGFFALLSIVLTFTLFELWRFIGAKNVPATIVARYLASLLPVATVELFPATMLITVLVTYALLARRSEAIAWWASGQSVYRLMIPGVLFAISAGAGLWLVQEHLMPSANRRQEVLRARIRGGQPRAITGTGRQWLASIDRKRLYSYEYDDQRDVLNRPTIYELDDQGVHLIRVTTGSTGSWVAPDEMLVSGAESVNLRGIIVERQVATETKLSGVDPPQAFKPSNDRPSQLSVAALRPYVRAARRRGVDVSVLMVALQRKYVNPVSVVIMAFIGMPLALAFGRRGALVAMCIAVGVSVAYWGAGGAFQQLGNHGLLPPEVAAWIPPVLFLAMGTYFLSRVRT
jgi:LPS export ABC transporter permease LptF/LPS export ABC transporter permease LptG